MKIIVIACAGGMTSGLLCSKVIKETEKLGMKGSYISMHELFDQKMDIENSEKLDLLLIYGAAQSVTKEKLKQASTLNISIDYIFIAPQMRHVVHIIKKDCGDSIGIESIGFQDFGMMRGDRVLDRIKEVVDF